MKNQNEENWESKAQWVYEAPNLEELAKRYDEWATNYDEDINNIFGNFSPRYTVETFMKYVSTDAKVLDAGAGTGLVGEVLQEYGYHEVEALELSRGMIEEARKKNIYSALHQGILGEALEIASGTYDAIIAKGVFGPGHAPSHAFDELIRITKPGGYIVFTIRTDVYENSEYEQKVSQLEKLSLWKLIEKTDKFNCWPKATKSVFYNIWIYQVTKL